MTWTTGGLPLFSDMRSIHLSAAFCLLSFLLSGRHVATAQDTLIVVYGTVKDLTTNEPLPGAQVEALDMKWGRRFLATMLSNGRYELDLFQEADLMIEYSAPGHVPKRVRVDMHGPTAEDWSGGYGMNVDVRLFREVEGLDLSMGGEPFGICRYDSVSDLFAWDLPYTEGMRERMKSLVADYERRVPPAPSAP